MIKDQDFERIILEKYGLFFDSNSQLLNLANSTLKDVGEMKLVLEKLNYFEKVISVLFPSCIKKFSAIQVLCTKGYADNASLILRSIINALIDVYYMKTDPTKLGERYLRYDFVIRKKKLDILKKYSQANLVVTSADSVLSEQDVLDEFEKFRITYPKANLSDWSGKSISDKAKKAAEVLGEEGKIAEIMYDYGYRYFSDFEHNNVMSLYNHIDDKKKGKFIISCGPNENEIKLVLMESFRTLIPLLNVYCNTFKLDYSSKIKILSERFANSVSKQNNINN